MSQIDYAAMSEQELKQYFLEHCDDKTAFKAYLARRHQRNSSIITTINAPDFEAKIHAAIRQQMSNNA